MKPAPPLLPRRLLSAVLGTILLAAALLTLFLFDPNRHGFYPRCLLHSLTGLNCAGCGSLRATHHLLHGEFLPALRSNTLLVLAALTAGWMGLRWLRGEPLSAIFEKWFARPAVVLGLLVITIIFSVLRNLPFAAFAWMNP